MSELERAIGGKFELPSLDLDAPPREPASERLSLAESLEQAAACVRDNDLTRARKLLQDVIRKGDDRQRETARDLLSRLA